MFALIKNQINRI